MSEPERNWTEENQRALSAEIARVRSLLERKESPVAPVASDSAIANVCAAFELSPFERDVLLLCAGLELDSEFAAKCAVAQGDPRKPYPTFSLALAALREPHWSALLPVAPLRRWRLVELGASDSITTSPLRIDERILHYLTGVSYLDERLHGLVEPLRVHCRPTAFARRHRRTDRSVMARCRSCQLSQLFGKMTRASRDIAAAASAKLGLQLARLAPSEIPSARWPSAKLSSACGNASRC